VRFPRQGADTSFSPSACSVSVGTSRGAALASGAVLNIAVAGGKFEFPRDGLRHLALEPDVLEFIGVFGLKLDVGFGEFLEKVALLFLREIPPLVLDVLP